MTRNIYLSLVWLLAGLGAWHGHAAEFDADMPGTTQAIRVWHLADGLPSDTVTAIIQTRDGFLWIGTSAGLARFDGAKFTEIKETGSPTNRLTGVTALCEDRNGHLWIGTQQNGLFELANGRMHPLHSPQRIGRGRNNNPGGGQRRQGVDRGQRGFEFVDRRAF